MTAVTDYQIKSFSASDELRPSFFPLYSDKNNTGRRCDIIALSAEVYLQMSAASPEECHTTCSRIPNEEQRLLSGCRGYSGTVNEN